MERRRSRRPLGFSASWIDRSPVIFSSPSLLLLAQYEEHIADVQT